MPTFAGTSAAELATDRSVTAQERRHQESTLYPTSHRAPRLGASEELSLALRLQRQRRVLWTALLSDRRWRRTVVETANAALDADRRPASGHVTPECLQPQFVNELAECFATADRDGVAARAALDLLDRTDADGAYVERCIDAHADLIRTRCAFVEANLGLVVVVAKRYERGHLGFEDLVQEGNAGLLKAVDRFDPSRGFRFSTYAVWWIRHAIGRALSDKSREIRLPVHVAERQQTVLIRRRRFEAKHGRLPTHEELAAELKWPVEKVTDLLAVEYTRAVGIDRETNTRGPIDVDQFSVDPEIPDFDAEVLRLHLRRGLRELSDMEQDILIRRFGLDGRGPMTLREVGLLHNLSRERIRQLQERALVALRRMFGKSGLV